MGGVECDLERGALGSTCWSSGSKRLGERGIGRLALVRHDIVLERAGTSELCVGRRIGGGGVLRLSRLVGVSGVRRHRGPTGLSGTCRRGGLTGIGRVHGRLRFARLGRVRRLTGVGGVCRCRRLAGLGRIHGIHRLGRVCRCRRVARFGRLTRTSRIFRRCGLAGTLRGRIAGQCATIRARRHSRVARPRCRCSPLHIVLCRSASDRRARLHLIGTRQRHDRGARNAQRGHEAHRTQGELDTNGQLSSWFHLPHPFQSSRAAPARRPGHISHMR